MRHFHAFRGNHLTAAVVTIIGCLLATSGCTTVTIDKAKVTEHPTKRYAAEGERINADPVAYLRRVYQSCDALEHYRLTFYRQERVGALVQSLAPMERIDTLFRKSPFSVKFTWNAHDADYFESVYAEGQNGNKLIIRERKGVFPFPPQVRVIDPALPAKIGKARNSITDFGLARVTQRTLLPFEDPALVKVMTIRYQGLVDLDPAARPSHHLLIERPPTRGYAYTRQDFYIDAESLLPAGTDLWLKSGELGARYRYVDIRTDVRFTDQDFRLSKDHPEKIAAEE